MREPAEINKLERVVIGYVLNNPNLYMENIEFFSKDVFIDSRCNSVINAIKSLTSNSKSIDVLSICEETKIDIAVMSDLYQEVDYNIDFASALSIVATARMEMMTAAYFSEASRRILSGDDVYKVISETGSFIASNEMRPIQRMTHISDNVSALMNHIVRLSKNEISGTRTNLTNFDEHTGGLQPSDLIVIAGETSQGKTALALSIAYNVAINKFGKVGIFSLEMSNMQLTARLSAMETNISSKKILFEPMNAYNLQQFNGSIKRLVEADIYIDECANSSIDYIIAGIKIAVMQYGIKVAVVDYLQLVKDGTKRNDESEIASNTRRFKNVAKELNITVILLSQLKREQNPRPTIGRLRGSGQIEEAADLILLIWRPEYYNIATYDDAPIDSTEGTAEIIIAKGRNYGVGKFWLNFNAQLTYFSNLDYGQSSVRQQEQSVSSPF